MSRARRLLDLVQVLRRHRRPVTAAALAEALSVTPRTIYRDIASLVGQGAPIVGEAGLGYMLQPGFFLPPLMFEPDEIDALLLGLRFVAQRGDPGLEAGARNALAKIAAVLPPEREADLSANGLLAGPGSRAKRETDPAARASPADVLSGLRKALSSESTLRLSYVDKTGRASERVVWPVAVGFFETVEVLAAWCETRRDFRHFRLDRIRAVAPTGHRMPKRRRILIADWRARENLDRML